MNQKLSRTEQKRSAIIDAAKKLFLADGLDKTSMDCIAQEANVSKKTVYHHFADKQVLFEFIVVNQWKQVQVHPSELFGTGKTVKSALKNFADRFLEFAYDKNTISLFRILIGQSNNNPDMMKSLVEDGKAPYTQALADFLRDKSSKGELTITDVDLAAAQFIGLLKEYHYWPMMLGFVSIDDTRSLDKAKSSAISMFLSFYAKK